MKTLKSAIGLALTLSVNLFASHALASEKAAAKATEKIKIVNELGQPIAGAEVMVGHAPNDPFPNNILTTDINGVLAIPSAWKTALPITVEAGEYVRTTFTDVAPVAATWQLHRKDAQTLLEVKGQTSHFQGIKKDGKVDFGLVFPALRRRQLLQFDVTTMISPETDTIRVLTEKLDIPSNLTLPEQKETYILPVTLKKPAYRMYVKEPGDYRLIAAHGQFPLNQVIDDLQDGKSFFDVLGHFRFLSGGQRDVQILTAMNNQDIAVNQIPFDATVNVTGPALTGTQVMVSIPMVDQGGLFFPSDLKRVLPGQTVALRVPGTATDKYIASILMSEDEANRLGGVMSQSFLKDKNPRDILFVLTESLRNILNPATASTDAGLSLTFSRATDGLVPEFIPLVPRPVVNGDRLELGKPAATAAITPIATYVVLAEIQKPPRGQYGAERRYRLWEVFAPGWVDAIDLPQLHSHIQPGKTYRWEVLFLGKESGNKPTNGYFLDDVTHLSRNSLDF